MDTILPLQSKTGLHELVRAESWGGPAELLDGARGGIKTTSPIQSMASRQSSVLAGAEKTKGIKVDNKLKIIQKMLVLFRGRSGIQTGSWLI